MWIRPARPTDAEARAATALVLAAKAHWGYDDAFMAACRDELTVTAADIPRRRIAVAEAPDGELAGLVCLDGTPPHGRIGLLFVAPHTMRAGLGRALYAHAVEEAGALGFTGLTIESDPHAVGFYLALGARPVPGTESAPLPALTVPIPARPGWARAWTGGRRAVHLGNVAEFQAQFAPATTGRVGPAHREAADHYACLAAFTGLHPAAVVLPGRIPDGWLGLVAERLRWSSVELYDETDEAALLARGGLGDRWRDTPVVPWGRTPAVARLDGQALPPDALRYESKRASHELFARLAPGHPGIRPPERWTPANRRAAARLIAARARTGRRTVAKTEHGAGGSGTVIHTARPRPRALPRGPLLLEEYVDGATHPTYDGLVDVSGTVHDVGVAAMTMDGTAYRGATAGPGAVSDATAERATRFGHAVGTELAATGYRGWFDVDYIEDGTGRLAPAETNLRLTGPSVAFMIRQRLAETGGGAERGLVRTLDHVPLGARLPDAELIAFLARLAERCATLGTVLVPTIPTAAYAPTPYVGLAIAAPTPDHLAAVDAFVRAECAMPAP
ncbi:GNAT family N-acetyltransferase [Streptomyces sp. NPDC020875]|uniref:GNAT family N-acetyltransferase n=1 Tax=Streptomyces sp. NPDC020875 TaxID=3154898 RepID=UPI0033CDC9F7